MIEANSNTMVRTAPVVCRPKRIRIDALLATAALLLLVIGVLDFGSVYSFGIALLEIGFAALFVCWAAAKIVCDDQSFQWKTAYVPLLAIGILAFMQLLPHRSEYWYASYRELLLLGGLLLFFVVVSETFRREAVRKFAVAGLAALAPTVALFALVQRFVSNGKIYWLHAPLQGSSVIFGPYVNRNHYAGFVEMTAPFVCVLALQRGLSLGLRACAVFGAAVLYASVVVSGSRGGVLACTAQLVVCAVGWGLLRQRGRHSVALLVCLVVSIGILAVWLDGSHAAERLLSFRWHDDISEGRAALYKDALRMIRERPVFGFGLGTFASVFPQYRTFYTSLEFTHLHNDILQPFVEMGILGGLCWLAFLGCVLRKAILGLLRSQSQGGVYDRTLRFASFIGIVGLVVHSFADFNLHIPANAALFTALCAWATNDPESTLTFEPMRHSRSPMPALPSTH